MYNPRVTKDYDTYMMFLQSDTIGMSYDNLDTVEGKNFEILKQTIGLRAVPESIAPLSSIRSLKESGSEKFVGKGYMWAFAIEAVDIFENRDGDPVGLLVTELNDIVLPSGDVLKTHGDEINIEFIKGDFGADIGDSL